MFILFLWWCHVFLIIYDPFGLVLVSEHLRKRNLFFSNESPSQVSLSRDSGQISWWGPEVGLLLEPSGRLTWCLDQQVGGALCLGLKRQGLNLSLQEPALVLDWPCLGP